MSTLRLARETHTAKKRQEHQSQVAGLNLQMELEDVSRKLCWIDLSALELGTSVPHCMQSHSAKGIRVRGTLVSPVAPLMYLTTIPSEHSRAFSLRVIVFFKDGVHGLSA